MTSAPKFDAHKALQELDHSGFTLIEDFLDTQCLAQVNALYDQWLGGYRGRNNFEGHCTERIYTLVGRDRLFQDIAEDHRILALCDALLEPNYLLTASQAIVISPGETPQPWHTDDSFYTIPRPRPMVSLSTIVAVEEFGNDNGGTEIIPGSHRWSDAEIVGYYRQGDQEEDPELADRLAVSAQTVTMPAGSCLVFAGTLLHRGGGNTGQRTRRAFSNQYCQPWARTQENFFLAISRERVRTMSARMQSLLGYSIHPPFMGQVTAYDPVKALSPDFVPPMERDGRAS